MSEHTSDLRSASRRPLGRSGISVPAFGVGTNRWNTDASNQARLNDRLAAAIDVGLGFVDTAEVYGFGRSETALGRAASADGRPVLLASKLAPVPHRVTAAQFASALDKTLKRLGRDSLDLYYLHFPYSVLGVDKWMMGMADTAMVHPTPRPRRAACRVVEPGRPGSDIPTPLAKPDCRREDERPATTHRVQELQPSGPKGQPAPWCTRPDRADDAYRCEKTSTEVLPVWK